MINATISADIIKSTSLCKEDMVLLQSYLERFVDLLEEAIPGSWGRITRGDNIECVVPEAKLGMQAALMLKCHVKAFRCEMTPFRSATVARAKFLRYGVRIAIGIGSLRTNDDKRGIIDGRAIYHSGRALDGMSTRMRTNMVIVGRPSEKMRLIQGLLNLSDELLSHATARQCQVILLRMCGLTEIAIAEKLGISQVAVNAHLRRSGWYSIANAMQCYEEVM